MSSQNVFGIATIDILPRDMMILRSLFHLSFSRQWAYTLAAEGQFPDILLVDGDKQEAVHKWRTLRGQDKRWNTLPTILVSTTNLPRNAPLYTLQRPLVASRVFAILDPIAQQLRAPTVVGTPQLQALIVDDSPTTSRQIQIELESLGIVAMVATNASEALAMLAKNHAYDLIFLDVVLPDVDGYNICRAIRKNPKRKATPVIMVTGKGSPFDRIRGKLAGCNTYLTKPLGRERFQHTVKKYLATRADVS